MTQDLRLFIILQVLCAANRALSFKDSSRTNAEIWLEVREAVRSIAEDLSRLKGLEK